MSEKLYETIEISNLKDMLNKTKNIYGEKPAYKIKQEEGKYKIITQTSKRNGRCFGNSINRLRFKKKKE